MSHLLHNNETLRGHPTVDCGLSAGRRCLGVTFTLFFTFTLNACLSFEFMHHLLSFRFLVFLTYEKLDYRLRCCLNVDTIFGTLAWR